MAVQKVEYKPKQFEKDLRLEDSLTFNHNKTSTLMSINVEGATSSKDDLTFMINQLM